MTATQEPITPQPKPTMASVLEENEFLKSEMEAYKQELVTAKESYEKELNFYTLARTTTMSEGTTTENPCREYMFCQCGDINYQTGYKVIQIPMPGASLAPSTFAVKEEEPVVTQELATTVTQEPTTAKTQEPAGPSKIETEPLLATNVKSKTPTFFNKSIQTVPIEESAPPCQINTHTLVE
jgi:hypothetical protein